MDLNRNLHDHPVLPWWRLPIVWLVIAGPVAVVVASFATLGLALRFPDPQVRGAHHDAAGRPAVEARNHAATPERAKPAPAGDTPDSAAPPTPAVPAPASSR